MPTLAIAYRNLAWNSPLPRRPALPNTSSVHVRAPLSLTRSAETATTTLNNSADDGPPWPVIGGAIVGTLTGTILLIVIFYLCCYNGSRKSSVRSWSPDPSEPEHPSPPPPQWGAGPSNSAVPFPRAPKKATIKRRMTLEQPQEVHKPTSYDFFFEPGTVRNPIIGDNGVIRVVDDSDANEDEKKGGKKENQYAYRRPALRPPRSRRPASRHRPLG